MPALSARSIVRAVLSGYALFGDEDPIIRSSVRFGRNPLTVVVGPNASGKSIFRRLAGEECRKAGVEFISLSMEKRSGGGVVNAFIYGDESWESTGLLSARTVTTGISTCQSREKDHVIFWDEPDTGMSDEMAAAAGKAILNFVLKKPKRTRAIFVVSHNRYLLRKLAAAKPHFVCLGDPLACSSLEEWVSRPVEPADLGQALEEGSALFRRISARKKG